MSWSFRVTHGDFRLHGSHFGVVTDEQKLTQDLRCALLEKMGSDDLHPEFGSLIDGGRRLDGREVAGVVGESRLDLVVMAIESEVRRIGRDYQGRQLARVKSDRSVYNKSTIRPREALISITNINVEQIQDNLNITVTLQTATGLQTEIALTLINPGV